MSERAMDSAAIVRSLELVAEHGDPTALVYARLFAAHPEMEALFVRDKDGGVRGNMLSEAINAILDFVARDTYGGNLMRVEIVNHENLGVPKEVFGTFFTAMRDAFKDVLGPAWTREFDDAWTGLLARIDGVLAAARTD
ncbi:MAG: globin [Micropepsaceae bacterium]